MQIYIYEKLSMNFSHPENFLSAWIVSLEHGLGFLNLVFWSCVDVGSKESVYVQSKQSLRLVLLKQKIQEEMNHNALLLF